MSEINGLTDAQEEMFDILKEECAELIQAVSKITRHGFSFESPKYGKIRDHLAEEVGDVLACLHILKHNNLFDENMAYHSMKLKMRALQDPDQKRVHYITPEMIP